MRPVYPGKVSSSLAESNAHKASHTKHIKSSYSNKNNTASGLAD